MPVVRGGGYISLLPPGHSSKRDTLPFVMTLSARIALVTGAGKGIGRAIALALAAEGVHVGLIARTDADLRAVSVDASRLGVQVATEAADISHRTDVERAVARLTESLGPIDILINNAGIAVFGSIVDMDPAVWEQMYRVNVFGTYYVTRMVLPSMIERRTGDIINVASTAGLNGAANLSSYAGSKAAVLRFTESLAAEVRRHDVRVTALLPSTVNTAMAAGVGLKIGPEDRMLQPTDVAELVIAALKLPARAFVRDMALLTTNPS